MNQIGIHRRRHRNLVWLAVITAIIITSAIVTTITLKNIKRTRNQSQPSTVESDAEMDTDLTRYISSQSMAPKNALDIYKQFEEIVKDKDPLKKISEVSAGNGSYVFNWVSATRLKEYEGNGRGLVVTTGDKYFRFAVHAIKAMRLLGSHLPVEIFYMGDRDLSPAHRDYFNQMGNVTTKDLFEHFDNEKLLLKGWFAKPFSVLASSFREVILFDADAVFMQRPEVLFREPGYVASGTYYYFDRITFWRPERNDFNTDLTVKRRFLDELFGGEAPDHIKKTRIYQGTSFHEQESGVVVLDKSKQLLALLIACQLNAPAEKVIVQVETHGDKETFFLGSAIARLPYYFDRNVAANLGLEPVGTINDHLREYPYGKLAHADKNDRVVWFNNAIVDDRFDVNSAPSKLTHLSFEGQWTLVGCLTDKARELDERESLIIKYISRVYSRDPIRQLELRRQREQEQQQLREQQAANYTTSVVSSIVPIPTGV